VGDSNQTTSESHEVNATNRGEDCLICSLYIPSQPELWAGLGTVPTNPSPEVLQRRLLRGRSFPGSRAKSILHNEKRCIMGSLV